MLGCVSLSTASSSTCMGPGRWLGFSLELISGCHPTGAPKGELEYWPLMGTPDPTAGDPGLSLTHLPATVQQPVRSLLSTPIKGFFFHPAYLYPWATVE